MYLFYASKENIDEDNGSIRLHGDDVNHIKNVLRLENGEHVIICDGQGTDFECIITGREKDSIALDITNKKASMGELPCRISLYQGLPKKDKLEFIVQKSVELGAARIVPVNMARTIVKIKDPSKEESRIKRYQGICESAAKQSKRGVIPKVENILELNRAIEDARENCDMILVPYENADGMTYTREVLSKIGTYERIGVFIGPEGGFEESEIEALKEAGAVIISLGHRILRTETAGLATLSMIMLNCER